MTDPAATAHTLAEIVARLNDMASGHRIGQLQQIRKEVKRLRRVGSRNIFPAEPPDPTWVHHFGGRTELQFNLGIEEVDGQQRLRHGVAFSLETSRSVYDPIGEMGRLMQHFNDYVTAHQADFWPFQMWTWTPDGRGPMRPAGPIRPEDARVGSFIFMGKLGPAEPTADDLHTILKDLDRLLPLYEYVLRESVAAGDEEVPIDPVTGTPSPTGKGSTVLTRAEQILDVDLRHNRMQAALHKMMVAEHGEDAVRHEHGTDFGGRVDLRVLASDGTVTYYEIKTGGSARACVREALGQLLEYAHWPAAEKVDRMVVVGDAAATPNSRAYLDALRDRYGLPLEYMHLPPPVIG